MKNLRLSRVDALEDERLMHAECMAFDGTFFYVASYGGSVLFQMDPHFNIINDIKTRHPYDKLCYDTVADCFWAMRPGGFQLLRLRHDFSYASALRPETRRGDAIYSLAYDPARDRVLLFCTHAVSIMDKADGAREEVRHRIHAFRGCGCTVGDLLVIAHYLPEARVTVLYLTDQNRLPINCAALPESFRAKSLCAVYDENGRAHILAFAHDASGAPHLLRYLVTD